jgi:protein associated with RNAse G/E
MSERQITINARKYDGHIRRSWSGGLVSQTDTHLIVVGRFGADVRHSDLGLIPKGTISFEHFWLDRWYNVFRFYGPDGAFHSHYCNITMPPTFENNVLDYVDLDIDLILWPDGRVEVLDQDDFERNTIKFNYPNEFRPRVEAAVAELTGMIEAKEFPFDEKVPAM